MAYKLLINSTQVILILDEIFNILESEEKF